MSNWRFKNDTVHNQLMQAQETLFSELPNDARGTVFNYGQAADLPIDEGNERWRHFTVELVSYMVENEDYWENVRLVGSAVTNRTAQAFTAPGSDRPDVEGKPETIGLKLIDVQDLDILPCSAEIQLRAYDDSSDLTRIIATEFKRTAQTSLAGATASIPMGGSLQTIGASIINKVVAKVSSPDEIGSNQYILAEFPPRVWQRKPDDHYWVGHKFAYFYNYDHDDSEWEEGYLVLFRFTLLSRQAMIEGIPTSSSPSAEDKPAAPEVQPDPTPGN